MNIKDHIESGHYQKDERGYSIVPTRGGHEVVIVTTERRGQFPLVGWLDAASRPLDWTKVGCVREGEGTFLDLLPPPPRKVKVTRYAILDSTMGNKFCTSVETRDDTKLCRGEFFVELTGEYEEPWS